MKLNIMKDLTCQESFVGSDLRSILCEIVNSKAEPSAKFSYMLNFAFYLTLEPGTALNENLLTMHLFKCMRNVANQMDLDFEYSPNLVLTSREELDIYLKTCHKEQNALYVTVPSNSTHGEQRFIIDSKHKDFFESVRYDVDTLVYGILSDHGLDALLPDNTICALDVSDRFDRLSEIIEEITGKAIADTLNAFGIKYI